MTLDRVTTDHKPLPLAVMVYGPEKKGKTTFACSAPGAVLIPVEDGRGTIQVPAFPIPNSFDEFMQCLHDLAEQDHGHKAVAVDSLDKLEPLVWDEVCRQEGKQHIEDLGYGKGYIKADALWINVLKTLNHLRSEKGMTVILVAHSATNVIDDPELGSYHRTAPKLHKRASAFCREWADLIGMLDVERSPINKGEDGKRSVRTATASDQRVLHLADRGSFVAGSRYPAPAKVMLDPANPYKSLRDALNASHKKTKKKGGK